MVVEKVAAAYLRPSAAEARQPGHDHLVYVSLFDYQPQHCPLVKAILRRAGVRDARVHDARHTAATLLIEQGVHIRVVQEVLGHTRVTTTERYTHVATLQMKDASERMSKALWGQG